MKCYGMMTADVLEHGSTANVYRIRGVWTLLPKLQRFESYAYVGKQHLQSDYDELCIRQAAS